MERADFWHGCFFLPIVHCVTVAYLGFRKGGDKSRCQRHRGRDAEGVMGVGFGERVSFSPQEVGSPSPDNFAIFFLTVVHFDAFLHALNKV